MVRRYGVSASLPEMWLLCEQVAVCLEQQQQQQQQQLQGQQRRDAEGDCEAETEGDKNAYTTIKRMCIE